MDFDRFANNVASQIWNKLVTIPSFHSLNPADFADLFEAVHSTLRDYDFKHKGGKRRGPATGT